jgi:hypothetical protein
MNRQTATLDTSGMTALQKEEIYDMIKDHYFENDSTKMPLIYEIDDTIDEMMQEYFNSDDDTDEVNDRIDQMTLEFLNR